MDMKQKLWTIYFKYSRTGLYPNNKRICLRNRRIGTSRYFEVQKELSDLYRSGEGIKSIAKMFDLSYTNTRQLLEFLEIEIRRGQNVVTDKLREKRREKAFREHKKGIGWFDPDIRRKIESSDMRGIQGYYFNRSQNSWVWLRSAWEYIFAKWLDRTNHVWKVEETVYKIGSSIYRPDFFIYDNAGTLKRIVEIKGYWDSNSEKALFLNEQLKVDVSIITDIKKFIQEGSNYWKELELWKQTRLNSIELGELSNG